MRQQKYRLWFVLLILTSIISPTERIHAHTPVRLLPPHQKQTGYKVGDIVSNFSLKNIDGENIGLNNYSTAKGIILVFTSQHCPFAKAYEDRIDALSKKFLPLQFPLIAINPSDPAIYQDDSLEKLKERVKEKSYQFPYLIDNKQAISKIFGATRTPQVYVLLRNGSQFIVKYIGMIDDSPQDGQSASKFYVDDAVTNLLAGKPVVTTITKPIGCVIKTK